MKWVIRIFGSIIGLFVIGIIAGAFMPSMVSAERSVLVYAQPEDVFSYLSDLEDYEAWSPWKGDISHGDYVVGGSDSGVGQEAAWTCQDVTCLPGTQTIKIVQYPEFVQAALNLDGQEADATYALMDGGGGEGSLTILVKVDLDVGGFPYVQRIFKSKQRTALESRIDTGLSRLEKLINKDLAK